MNNVVVNVDINVDVFEESNNYLTLITFCIININVLSSLCCYIILHDI